MTLYRAAINTRHFAFEAYGLTAEEARATLAGAWVLHARQTGADPHLIDGDLADLTPYAVHAGQAFRDGALLPAPVKRDPLAGINAAAKALKAAKLRTRAQREAAILNSLKDADR